MIAVHADCNVSETQWNYDELSSYSFSYGSDEGNGYQDTGCLSVLVVGCVLFLYSASHLAYILVSENFGINDASGKYQPLGQEEDSHVE